MRSYSAEERAEAVALAASIGPLKASKAMHLPTSTVTGWMHRTAAAPIIAAANASIAERLREAHSEALSVVRAGLADPTARLADKATALRVLGEQLALAEGRATSNVEMHTTSTDEALTDAERSELRAYLDQQIAAYEADHPELAGGDE